MSIELSQIVLNNGLTFLAIVTALVIGVVGYFLVKLIKDLSVLTKNVNETSLILNTELKPTLKELNDTMHRKFLPLCLAYFKCPMSDSSYYYQLKLINYLHDKLKLKMRCFIIFVTY